MIPTPLLGAITVPLALFGWPVAVFLLFLVLRPRYAVLVGLLVAWLFLPVYSYALTGLPDWNKTTATCAAVLMGAAVFDAGRLTTFRAQWADLPIAVWCLCPLASSLLNGYGPYDGFSSVLNQTVTWGLSYFIGRIYFTDLKALHELAIGIFVGALVYVPLCLLEIRLSPQLHTWVYGFHQHEWGQTRRFGGWRPVVFMRHGLAVGMFMSMAALLGIWLWYTKSLRKISVFPLRILAPILLATAVLCKSLGAVALLIVGGASLLGTRIWRSSMPIVLLLLMPLGYMTARFAGGWDGDVLIESAQVVSAQRAHSLRARLNSETAVFRSVQSRVIFGASRFLWVGEAIDSNTPGRGRIIPDGMWLIALAKYGLVGLCALTAALLVPPLLFLRTFPAARWDDPRLAAGAAFSVIMILYVCDNLFNAMVNPLFMLIGGALVGTVVRLREQASSTPSLRPPIARS